MLFPLVPNLQTQKVLPKSKGVLWYEVSQRDNSRRSFCLAKHTPTIHPQESHGQNGCKRIPLILPWEWQQVRFIFPGQRMKANSLPRQPDYQSSLWVLPEFNANEDSCHQDGILCSNLPGRKEGFMRFGGCRDFIIFVHVSQHMSVVTYTASRTAGVGLGCREGDPKQQWYWRQEKP